MRFKDKTAIITGGGRGIGATTALMMLAEGAKVGIVDLNEANMKKVTETAESRGLSPQDPDRRRLQEGAGRALHGGVCEGVRPDRYPGQ